MRGRQYIPAFSNAGYAREGLQAVLQSLIGGEGRFGHAIRAASGQ